MRSSSAWMVRLSGRVYRELLVIYPASFRHTYAASMTQVFQDWCRATYHQSGLTGLLLLWPATLHDMVMSASQEHLWEVLRWWKGNAMLQTLARLLVRWHVTRFAWLFLLPLLLFEGTFLSTTISATIAGTKPDWNGNGLVHALNTLLSDPRYLLLSLLFQGAMVLGPVLALAVCTIPILHIDLRREAGSIVGTIRLETSSVLRLATMLLSVVLLGILAGYLLLENTR